MNAAMNEAHVQWAVTSEFDWANKAIDDISEERIFPELKDALEWAKEYSQSTDLLGKVGLYVWLLSESRSLVAIAVSGKLFYSYDPSLPHPDTQEIVPASNPLRAAFPWAVNPESFSIDPGLSKRELMAGTLMGGLISDQVSSVAAIGDLAEVAVTAADALLYTLGGHGKTQKRKDYLTPSWGWSADRDNCN